MSGIAALSPTSPRERFFAVRRCTFIAAIVAGTALHPGVVTGVYIGLCVWALSGARQAIKALSLSYMILLLNPVFRLPSSIGILRWLVLLIIGYRVVPLVSSKMLRTIVPLLLFYAVVVMLSWISSAFFLISFLKATIFFFCAAVVLIAFGTMDENGLADLKHWFFCLSGVVIVLSLPTLLIPSIGYARNGSGFQGLLNHPQAFAVFLAPVVVYLAAHLLMGNRRKGILEWALGGGALVLLFLTKARIAMVTLFLGIIASFAVLVLRSKKDAPFRPPYRPLLNIGIASVFLVSIISLSPELSVSVERFWLKGNEKTVETAFYASRGKGIVYLLDRFLQKPYTGNGFGVDPTLANQGKIGTFLDLPISASVEKGFLPAAMLEEVGIVGVLVFLPFFWVLVKGALDTGDIRLAAMFFACFLVNFGEAIFFSPGQTGGYLWLLIGLTTANGWSSRCAV